MAEKPAPLTRAVSQPFWQGLEQRRIMLQHCCGSWIFYPRPFCPRCGARDPEWRCYGGTPLLYSFTVAHAPVSPDFMDEAPLLLAIVALEPGIHMPATIVDCEPAALAIGMALAPVFDAKSFPQLTVLRFRPYLSNQDTKFL